MPYDADLRAVESEQAEPSDFQFKPTYPRLIRATVGWRRFCEQWRHSYLLLAAVFWPIWRLSAIVIPKLEDIRIMGGLHPLDVLLLRDELKLMWVPPLLAMILYVLSFRIRRLNTAAAVAATALCSSLLLVLVLLSALIRISL